MVTITVAELAREVRQLAERHPDRVAACTYVRHDENDELVPNCIVGVAAYNLGIPLGTLYEVNSCGITDLASGDDVPVPEWLDVSATNAKVYIAWLGAVQGRQDARNTWGEALRFADRRLVAEKFNI